MRLKPGLGKGPGWMLLSLLATLGAALCLTGCADAGAMPGAADAAAPAPVVRDASASRSATTQYVVPPEWEALRDALAADGLSGPIVDRLLASLGPRSQAPMGRKMVELYRKTFLSSPEPRKKSGLPPVYKGVVTERNADLCLAYIKEHMQAFHRAARVTGVPPSTAAALLFVETRLGRVLKDGPDNALHTLASMSQSLTLDSIDQWYGKMPGYQNHEAWFSATMPKRAAWAYRETRALVRYMVENHIAPDSLPGSIYGAIGLCQFMPSNIEPYGVDGNGDGVIDLYQADDAIMSLANYLYKHGWRAGASRAVKHKVLMRYNKSARYANTILALGELVEKRQAAGSDAAQDSRQ